MLYSMISKFFMISAISSYFFSISAIQDYIEIAKIVDWPIVITELAQQNSIRILDVGCGTGRWIEQFKAALQNKCECEIIFDLVDPSKVSIDEASQKVKDNFILGNAYQSRIQDAYIDNHYDLIWSIHSFYAFSEAEVTQTIEKCLKLLKPGGIFLIILATADSFYSSFYKIFRTYYQSDQPQEYSNAERIRCIASTLGVKSNLLVFSYNENIAQSCYNSLLHFLLQECIGYSFNRDVNNFLPIQLKELLDHPAIGPFLEQYLHENYYVFPQTAEVFILKNRSS